MVLTSKDRKTKANEIQVKDITNVLLVYLKRTCILISACIAFALFCGSSFCYFFFEVDILFLKYIIYITTFNTELVFKYAAAYGMNTFLQFCRTARVSILELQMPVTNEIDALSGSR